MLMNALLRFSAARHGRLGLCATACLVVAAVGEVVAADAPQLAVYVMNLDGGDLKKVAQAPGKRWHAGPSWSPDRQLILFHAYPNDVAAADSHVFVVKSDGTDVKDLGLGGYACWSSD